MSWKKGALIGGIIFIVLAIIYYLSGLISPCIPGEAIGQMCLNNLQNNLLTIFELFAFPFILLGANANPDLGPINVIIFWIGSIIGFLIIGAIIGLIFRKRKN